ncbi:MAG: flavin reductase family protein [Bacteroidales bacterium]|nr:flavin reductase family protein [Bacteroidales bacterium]
MNTTTDKYIHFNPKETPLAEFHGTMLGAVAPRPIALASTIDKEGRPNLSPFSFFNAFGANPPILIFSPARRGHDSTTKHSYENVKEVPEVVINVVNYEMVQKMNDSSAEFAKGVNEFDMVGFTMEPSELVKPFRVKESPVQFECKVLNIVETGVEGGAGNLVICEIIRMHVNTAILDSKGRIDPQKIDLVGRMGGNYYVRASGESLFELAKPQ